jgi:hypothetical protein
MDRRGKTYSSYFPVILNVANPVYQARGYASNPYPGKYYRLRRVIWDALIVNTTTGRPVPIEQNDSIYFTLQIFNNAGVPGMLIPLASTFIPVAVLPAAPDGYIRMFRPGVYDFDYPTTNIDLGFNLYIQNNALPDLFTVETSLIFEIEPYEQ